MDTKATRYNISITQYTKHRHDWLLADQSEISFSVPVRLTLIGHAHRSTDTEHIHNMLEIKPAKPK